MVLANRSIRQLQRLLGDRPMLCRLLRGGGKLGQHRHLHYVGIGLEFFGQCVNRLKCRLSIACLGSNIFSGQ